MSTPRTSTFPIQPLILNRWSARAMSGESITTEELMPLFEAARWAPSSYNNQPWRFIYATRESAQWEGFKHLLNEFNATWATNASALVVIVSRKEFEFNNQPTKTHSFDTGAAWENLALEASARGLVCHGIEGFDYEKARTELQVPDLFDIEMMIAIGKPGNKETLPTELQEREAPSDRKPLSELVMEGAFKA